MYTTMTVTTVSSNLSVDNTSMDEVGDYVKITWDKVLVGIILYGITLVTIVGNVLVLIAVKTEKSLHTTFNYYIVNLAITDVSVAVTAMSFQATYTVLGEWPFGEILCGFWIFFDYGMTFVSVFTLILISVDRFWSVTWSVNYKLWHTRRKCLASVVAVWVFMLVLWLPSWITDRIQNSEPGVCYYDPSSNKEFVFIIAILGHHGPYCVMIFCYTYVFAFMHKRRRVMDISGTAASNGVSTITGTTKDYTIKLEEHELDPSTSNHSHSQFNISACSNTHTNNTLSTMSSKVVVSRNMLSVDDRFQYRNAVQRTKEKRMGKERRVFVTLTYIMIGYAVLWLPFHIVFDISIANPAYVPDSVLNLAFWMAYFNSTLNPILYNCSSTEFRKAFKRILSRGRWV